MRKLISLLVVACMLMSICSFSMAEAINVTGTSKGFGGDVTVTLTIEDGVITEVVAEGPSESAGIGSVAIDVMPGKMVEINSIVVDVQSGATFTSNAVLDAAAQALASAGMTVEDLKAVEIAEEEIVLPFAEDDIDVIVVGAGFSGLSAAARAAELGANVLVIEKTNATGGSSNLSGGSLIGVNTKVQQAAGIQDYTESLLGDFVRIGGAGTFNEELARVFADNSGAAVDWISDVIGVPMNPEVQDGAYTPMSILRVHYNEANKGGQYSQYLREYIDQKTENAMILFDTAVTDLIMDENYVVSGVKVTLKNGAEKEFYAPSTILATGGYGGNEAVLKQYNFTNITTSSPACVSGDGYTILGKYDVAFTNMDFCTAYGGSVPISGFARVLTFNTMNGALWMNQEGARMTNEPAADSTVRSNVWTNASENIVYMVFNEELLPMAETKLFTTVEPADNEAKIAELMSMGVMFKADTVEELAAAAGIDAAAMEATIAAFNASCAAGVDEFGRTAQLVAMENGPFYAVKTVPYVLITSGGPYVTRELHPVTNAGVTINGLYCVGELVGTANIGGRTSIGGAGHGSCLILGKLAAEEAVAVVGK